MKDGPPSRPTVSERALYLPGGQYLDLDTSEWDAWLAQAISFDVHHTSGPFIAVREQRKRGSSYWVARRYDKGRRASVYIGTRVTAEDLARAGDELAVKIAAQSPKPVKARPPRRVLSAYQLDDITVDSDPVTMRALVADLLSREHDPARRAALEALQSLVDSIWPVTSKQ